MPSFQIAITPKRRAAARFVVKARRALQKAFADEQRASGVTQSELARRIEVNRSVVSRELRGQRDVSLSRIGEYAWAMGYEPKLVFEKPVRADGQNWGGNTTIAPKPAPLPAKDRDEVTMLNERMLEHAS
jgi:hypothetical protein